MIIDNVFISGKVIMKGKH